MADPDAICGCGARFGCGARTGHCWCFEKSKVIPAAGATGCLCPDCLARLTAGRPATFKQWLDATRGQWPPPGVAGVLTDWFPIGDLDLPAGRVSVTDLWLCYPDQGNVSADVPPGRYTISARGIAWGDVRRVAAVRATLADVTPAGRGLPLGTVECDSWGVVLADVETWQADAGDDEINAMNDGHHGLYADGCEIAEWTLAGRTARVTLAFAGLGDGGYDLFELLDAAGRRVGVECEFIGAGYTEHGE